MRRHIALILLVLTWTPVAALAQPVTDLTTEASSVRAEAVRDLLQRTQDDARLPESVRTAIADHCTRALGALERAERHRSSALASEGERAEIDARAESLRRELELLERQPPTAPPEVTGLDEAEDALERVQARHRANLAALNRLQRQAEERAQARTDTLQRLGVLDLELQLVEDELGRRSGDPAHPQVEQARRLSLLARRQAVTAESTMLRARLDYLADRGVLGPLEIDLATRRTSDSEELVNRLTEITSRLRTERRRARLAELRELSRTVAADLPSLAELADETEALAETLLAADGILEKEESAERLRQTIQTYGQSLARIAEITHRKFAAFGYRGSVARWWPEIPPDFPRPGAVAAYIQTLDERIPEVAQLQISNEQLRAGSRELARRTLAALQAADPATTDRVRELLTARQGLLDELILAGGRYSDHLTEARTAAEGFRDRLHETEQFLYSHVLWSRSVPRPIIPRVRDLHAAAGWLVAPDRWRGASVVAVDFRGGGMLAALLVIAIILGRQPLIARLQRLGNAGSEPTDRPVRDVALALGITLLLALPLPVLLAVASTVLGRMGETTFLFSISQALGYVALTALLLEVGRQLNRAGGLAERHFRRPPSTARGIYRSLATAEVIGLPLLLVALVLAGAGIRFDSPPDLQLYNNTLGRLSFVIALMMIGGLVLGAMRPKRHADGEEEDGTVRWPPGVGRYAVARDTFAAAPLVALGTLLPAALAAAGFYVTALLLGYQMLRTLLLVLVVAVGLGCTRVWREALARDRAEPDSATTASTDRQIQQVASLVAALVLMVGLYGIWSDALPKLQILHRIQLLPTITLLDQPESAGPATTAAATATDVDRGEAAVAVSGGDPPTSLAAGEPGSGNLTLAQLLLALFTLIVTALLVKDLPGVVDIVLQRRTRLDGGARFALCTLIRYTLTILGTVMIANFLGLSWSNVQWLAAALTFGLGFGLQEIVANFVSGIILLVERPVRVGDVVTIGNLMGRVTRIQIRATTITLWDRSEMIVPNKEFITTKLVNWTLSDSKRRIQIPLRVAYGADLELAKSTLVRVAEEHPAVLDDPAPRAIMQGFGDDAINLELRFVVDFGHGESTKDEVQMAVDRAFREAGIEFALPRSEVHLVTEPPPE